MSPTNRRLQLDLLAARYLESLERKDFSKMSSIWQAALTDPELEAILHEIHAGVVEEQTLESGASTSAVLTAAVEKHLPSAEIIQQITGPVMVADVAEELYHRTPDRLAAEAHLLNEQLRALHEPLPSELGISGLTTWGNTRFGSAPGEYWAAFRRAAVKLELQRAAEAEYQMAARGAPKSENKT